MNDNQEQSLRDLARQLFNPEQGQPVEQPATPSNYAPTEGRIPNRPTNSELEMRDFVAMLFAPDDTY